MDYSDKAILILWDLENCKVPSDVEPEDVYNNVVAWVRSLKLFGDIHMISVIGVEESSRVPPKVVTAIKNSRIEFKVLNDSRKNAADYEISAIGKTFIEQYQGGDPQVLIVISNDSDLLDVMRSAKTANFATYMLSRKGEEAKTLRRSKFIDKIFCWLDVTHNVNPPKCLNERKVNQKKKKGGGGHGGDGGGGHGGDGGGGRGQDGGAGGGANLTA